MLDAHVIVFVESVACCGGSSLWADEAHLQGRLHTALAGVAGSCEVTASHRAPDAMGHYLEAVKQWCVQVFSRRVTATRCDAEDVGGVCVQDSGLSASAGLSATANEVDQYKS